MCDGFGFFDLYIRQRIRGGIHFSATLGIRVRSICILNPPFSPANPLHGDESSDQLLSVFKKKRFFPCVLSFLFVSARRRGAHFELYLIFIER